MTELTKEEKVEALNYIKSVLIGAVNIDFQEEGICIIYACWLKKKGIISQVLMSSYIMLSTFPELYKLKEVKTIESESGYWFNSPGERLKALETIKL